MTPIEVDCLLLGATIVTMDAGRRIIESGALAVRGETIHWLGPQAEMPVFIAKKTLNVSGMVITPGLVNTHGHWAMTLFRGFADDDNLEGWLEKIWKVEAAIVAPDTVIAGADLAMIEMIRSGTTCATDMYWQFEGSVEAVVQAGFRTVNGPVFAAIPGFEDRRQFDLQEAHDYLHRHANQPLLHLCVQAHSVYTTDRPMLEDVRRIAHDFGIGFITHAAESKGELAQVSAQYGKSPIEVLDDCVHLTDAEIARLAETGTSVSHCPTSNLKLSSGISRLVDMTRAGVNVAIGTDGPASNNDLNFFHEAQLAALVQKGVTGDPFVLPAPEVFAMMTVNGARAFGLSDKIGSLEVGKLADLAVIDFTSANMTPCYDIYSHLVYAAAPADVRHTMIHGRLVMEDCEIRTIDEERVKHDVRKIADRARPLFTCRHAH
jgi:5-methylthioadenosine/S-adenosylhomocysteine deaminase